MECRKLDTDGVIVDGFDNRWQLGTGRRRCVIVGAHKIVVDGVGSNWVDTESIVGIKKVDEMLERTSMRRRGLDKFGVLFDSFDNRGCRSESGVGTGRWTRSRTRYDCGR